MKNIWIIGKIISVIAALAGALSVVTAIDIANQWMLDEFYGETAHYIFSIAATIIILAYIAVAGLLVAFVFKIK